MTLTTAQTEAVKKLKERKKELEKILGTPPGGGDSKDNKEEKIQLNYIEKLIDIYNGGSKSTTPDDTKIRNEFDALAGFDKEKEQIRKFLKATEFLKKKGVSASKGQFLCLVGPAGTGKTEFGLLLAKVYNKKGCKISLAGKSDPQTLLG